MIGIVWTASAVRDMAAHLDYLTSRDPDTARRLEEAIRGAITRLSEFPNRGRPGRREGTRELLIAGWPYIVVYIVREARIGILRVLHTSQEWPPSDV